MLLAWEVWNEPNALDFWGDCEMEVRSQKGVTLTVTSPVNAPKYVRMLKAASQSFEAARAAGRVASGTRLLGGSLAGAEGHPPDACHSQRGKPAVDYLAEMQRQMARDSGRPYYDALALHPYSDVRAPADCRSNDAFWQFKCRVEQIRDTMQDPNKGGGPNFRRDIWITELGWAAPPTGPVVTGQVTLTQQAGYLEDALGLAGRWDYVPVAVWFNLVDRTYDEVNPKSPKEAHFGLFSYDRGEAAPVPRPKPAAIRFRGLMSTVLRVVAAGLHAFRDAPGQGWLVDRSRYERRADSAGSVARDRPGSGAGRASDFVWLAGPGRRAA